MDLILLRDYENEIIRECPKCKRVKHTSKCNLKLNPLKHYLGISPLWLCSPCGYIRKINPKSLKFAEMLATAWDGIEK